MTKLLLHLILIYKKDNIDIKPYIYCTHLRIMTKHEQNLLNLAINAREILCYLSKTYKIVLELEFAIIEALKMIFTNSKVQMYYLVIIKITAN